LYNKYRGLLRYYAYNPLPVGASVADARWFRNEISFFASGSPLLSFAGQTIVDIEDNTKDVSLLDPWPLQQSGWYIAQFEMAYDKNATHLPVPQSRIDWPLSFVKVNEVLLNNANATEQPVSLQAEKVNFNDVWSVYNKLQGNFKLHVKSMSSLDRLHGVFSTEVINNLKQSASTNSYGNLLNATAIPAEDYLNCRLDVPGSVSWDPKEVLYASVHVATPGPDNSQVIGSGPVFNEPMGIFYLDAKPIIHYTRIKNSLPEEYKLDVSSVKYVVNPFVRSYAEISNFNQEIVAMDSAETKSLTEARIYHGKMLKASEPLNILGVRVSFDITPKNGSATIKMIKTFTATVQP
jgi:hypothetical protein